MNYYNDVYMKRLNRYGLDYQSRIQTKREQEFENYLLKSIYRIDFEFNGKIIPGTFEKNKQDETEVSYYLLTRLEDRIPGGTILSIPNDKGEYRPWMVYYLEDMQVSAYNRYMMLRMTHHIWWLDREGKRFESYCYLYGQEDNMLKDEIKSRSRISTVYSENLKLMFAVMPRQSGIQKESLVFCGQRDDEFFEQFTITGYDNQSTLGVSYVSLDPTYVHDISKPPRKTSSEQDNEYFWLDGGKEVNEWIL